MFNRVISWILAHLFFCLFFRICPFFWMMAWMKNVNNFQITKIQSWVLLNICLIFGQFQPGVAYKSFAYKKKRVLQLFDTCRYLSLVILFLRLLVEHNASQLPCFWFSSLSRLFTGTFYRSSKSYYHSVSCWHERKFLVCMYIYIICRYRY